MTQRLRWAEARLNYSFADAALIDRAFTHRSAARLNNERLEFLGDAYLNFAIAKALFELRPEESEGDLSRLRAALVKGKTLADIGRDLELPALLEMGPGELRSGGANRDSTVANALEAIIGAILLDGGTDAANACVMRLFARRLEELPDAASLKDPKTRLQELQQGSGLSLPVYTVESVSGEKHRQRFVVSCELPESGRRAEGRGRSRRSAEQDAAERMLAELTGDESE